MEIKKRVLGDIEVNCYLLSTEKAAVVIDCGYYSKEVENFLIENSYKERLIILTHGHFDHIGGVALLREKTNVKIAIGEFDGNATDNPYINYSAQFGEELDPFGADIFLKDNDLLQIGDIEFKVLHSPGHTAGSICLLNDDILFSGDTLFYESVGRTDIGGNMSQLVNSLSKLMKLDGNIIVYSGHGPETTIAHEKKYNPFIRHI